MFLAKSVLVVATIIGFQANVGMSTTMVEEVGKKLPAGWTVTGGDNLLKVERNADMWLKIPGRQHVLPQDSSQSDEDYMRYLQTKGHARQHKFVFTFRYETAWPGGEAEKVKANNSRIKSELRDLPATFDVKHLKAGSLYVGGTDEERERVRAFQKRKTELQDSLRATPSFSGNSYSFFVQDNLGGGEKPGTVELQKEVANVMNIVGHTVAEF